MRPEVRMFSRMKSSMPIFPRKKVAEVPAQIGPVLKAIEILTAT